MFCQTVLLCGLWLLSLSMFVFLSLAAVKCYSEMLPHPNSNGGIEPPGAIRSMTCPC